MMSTKPGNVAMVLCMTVVILNRVLSSTSFDIDGDALLLAPAGWMCGASCEWLFGGKNNP